MAIGLIRRGLVALSVAFLSTWLSLGIMRAECLPAASQGRLPDIGSWLSSATDRAVAPQVPIWKTITIGIYQGPNAIRAAIDGAPCRIYIEAWADEIIGRPAFPYSRTKIELDLVVVAVADFGFDHDASLRDIHARALAVGLELCPPEAGPILRLNYLDQPIAEFIQLAMRPVARYSGEPIDLTLGNGGTGLLLLGGDARPEVVIPRSTRFVFVLPRPKAIVSSVAGQR